MGLTKAENIGDEGSLLHTLPTRINNKALASDPTLHPSLAFRIRQSAIENGRLFNGASIPLARVIIQHPFSQDTMDTLAYHKWQAQSESCDPDLTPFGSRSDPAEQLQYIRNFQEMHFDGMIIFHSELQKKDLDSLKPRIPLVFVDPLYDIPPEKNRAIIPVDYTDGIRDAVQALQRGGHTRIVFVSDSLTDEPTRMEEAYYAVMRELGIEEPDILADSRELKDPKSTLESGYEIGRYAFASTDIPAPTAFICARTSIAIGLLRAAYDSKRKFPGNVSVVGLGDKNLAEYASPRHEIPLITLERRDLTREACQLILLTLSGGTHGNPTPRPEVKTRLNVHTGEVFDLTKKWV